jgi:hypothetical protein
VKDKDKIYAKLFDRCNHRHQLEKQQRETKTSIQLKERQKRVKFGEKQKIEERKTYGRNTERKKIRNKTRKKDRTK